MFTRPYHLLLSTVPEETAANGTNNGDGNNNNNTFWHQEQHANATATTTTISMPQLPINNTKKMGKQQDALRNGICLASSLLLKVLLLLAAFLLLMSALSMLIPWLLYSSSSAKELVANSRHNNNRPTLDDDASGWSQNLLSDDERMLNEFLAFEKNYSRTFTSDEERLWRFGLFVRNMRELEQRIAAEKGGKAKATMTQWGVTEFFDWSDEELDKLVMPLARQQHHEEEEGDEGDDEIIMESVEPMKLPIGYTRPKHWDWREKGVVTHVKSQLRCGACWAFAVTALVETQHAICNGTLVTLSEQQLIDCDVSSKGCEGGYRPNAFRYIRDNGQLKENAYPYRANDGRCRLPPGPIDPSQRVFVDQLRTLPSDEEQIADWIVQNGPVTFGMSVTKAMFQYRGGVFDPSVEECAHQSVGFHAMEVIGFGETAADPEAATPYWIMKNSWGSGWGVNGGYLLMRRGVNSCGLAREVYTALIN